MKIRLANNTHSKSIRATHPGVGVAAVAGVEADLDPLCGAAASGLRFCRGNQVSVACYILDEVHEGGARVRARSDVDNITGAAKFKSGLRLSAK